MGNINYKWHECLKLAWLTSTSWVWLHPFWESASPRILNITGRASWILHLPALIRAVKQVPAHLHLCSPVFPASSSHWSAAPLTAPSSLTSQWPATHVRELQIQAAEESKQAAESFLSYKADIKFTLKLGDKRKTKDSPQKEHSINILE